MKTKKKSEREIIKSYFEEKKKIYSTIDLNSIKKLFNFLKKTYIADGTIYVMGNGGTAGIAEGFAVDLRTHPFVSEDKNKTTNIKRIKVICLTESSGALTGISNDIGFDFVYSEQLKNFLRNKNRNDLLIAFTASGNSQNMIEAINFAKKNRVITACVSGRGGGKASKVADLSIIISAKKSSFPGQTGKNDNNFHIEDLQNSISHILVGLFKKFINETNKFV